jgi:hypothetical protein
MMAGLGGLAMEVKVYALVRNLLGVLGLQQQYESGGGSTGEVQSPSIQDENLRSGNDLVEGIILNARTIFRVQT